jgi:hypothetical protein
MSGSPSRPAQSANRPSDADRSIGVPLLPVLLLVLALGDLRTEMLLLIDHFTFTSVVSAIAAHPLAVVVLLVQPSLWRRYRRPRR